MTKKIVIGACLMAMAASMFAAKAKEGKVLNVYVWNDEFPSRFNDYYKPNMSKDYAKVKVNFIQTPNQDNAYQNKLDEVLLNQKSAKADDKADIFLVEADYALKYLDVALDVKKDIGLTEEDLANQFKYTQDIMTDSDGNLKGVTWQACPAGFVYRRSFAKQVLGTDDPAKVQELLSNWDKFDAVAAKMKAAGYFMVSGFQDTYRVFSDNVKSAWVKGNKIVVDPQIQRWIDQTKTYTDNGYNEKTGLWSAEWTNGMKKDGKVFGYFGPAWFVDFSMPHGDGGADGDWAFCKGPQGYSWGGTWICAAEGTDNLGMIKDIMKVLTCDDKVMVDIAKKAGDFTNNEAAMKRVAKSDYKNDFLGGQNHMAFFIESAASIDKSTMSAYDQGMNEKVQNAMSDYFEGKVTLDKAWDNFYTSIQELYPELKK